MGKILNKKHIRLPFLFLGIILLTMGLLYDKWWWQSGAAILLLLLAEVIFALIVLD